MSDKKILLNFLEWVEKSRARQKVKDHVRILVQLYLAKLYNEGELGKEASE